MNWSALVPVSWIARWDGSDWSTLGGGTLGTVHDLAVHDEGSGQQPYAGGDFQHAGGVSARRVARWDGSNWSALGTGMNSAVYAFAVHDDGGSPALHAGGVFTRAGGVPADRIARWDGALDFDDSYLARWGCDTTAPLLSCPASVVAAEAFSGSPGEVVHFSVTAIDGVDPAPSVMCSPASGSFFPPGTTLVTCTAMDNSGNQAACQFPVVVHPKRKTLGR